MTERSGQTRGTAVTTCGRGLLCAPVLCESPFWLIVTGKPDCSTIMPLVNVRTAIISLAVSGILNDVLAKARAFIGAVRDRMSALVRESSVKGKSVGEPLFRPCL